MISSVHFLYRRTEWFFQKYGATLARTAMILILVALWVPIGVVIYMSFSSTGVLVFPPGGYSLDGYRAAFTNDRAIESIFNTLKVSLVATPITVILSTMFSYAVTRFTFKGKFLLQTLIVMPLVVPLIVIGVALTLFAGKVGLGGGFLAVTISHVIRTLPFATLIILPSFLAFDRTLEDAAKDLGANEIRTFRLVTLPNIMPGIIAGALLAFTISFNEFVYTYFVRGTGMRTLPIYLWGQIRYSVTTEVNVLSVLFLVVAIGLVLLAVFVTNVERLITTK